MVVEDVDGGPLGDDGVRSGESLPLFGQFHDAAADRVPPDDQAGDDGQQRQERVGADGVVEGHENHDAGDEQDGEPVGHRCQRGLVGGSAEVASAGELDESEVGQGDGGPAGEGSDGGDVEDDLEGLFWDEEVDEHPGDADDRGQQNSADGHAVGVEFLGEGGCGAGHGHGVEDASGGVHAGVEGGQRGGDDHEFHDGGGCGDADEVEEGDEGRFVVGVGAGWQEQAQEQH